MGNGGYLCSQYWQTVHQLLTNEMLVMEAEKYIFCLCKRHILCPHLAGKSLLIHQFHLICSPVVCMHYLSIHFVTTGKDAIIEKEFTLSLSTF